jgi:UDP-glucose 4-epimerase
MLHPINWLISGGCGFIGVNLIEHLVQTNSEVHIRIIDNLTEGTKDDLRDVCHFKEVSLKNIRTSQQAVELIVGDIRDIETCLQVCEGINIVVHLAANTGVTLSVNDPRQDMEVNVTGTFNMLEASRYKRVDKFIFASSGAPLGEVEPPIDEKKAPRPVSPYGASKLAGEAYCSAYYKTYGLRTVALRFGNVYGPRSKHKNSVVAKFIKRALAGKPLEIYGNGEQTRDFIYIKDLIQAILLAATYSPLKMRPREVDSPWGEVFQIATYRETQVIEIAEKIKNLIEGETGRTVDVVYKKPRVGDVKRNVSNITRAQNILGYKPNFDLEEGLKYTFDYFCSESLCKHIT